MKQSIPSGPSLRLTLAGGYWLVTAAGFAGIGIYKSINLILVLSYFLVVLLLINWWIVRKSLSPLQVSVDPIDDGFVGESRRLRCWVNSSSGRRVRGLQITVRLAQQDYRWYVPTLAPPLPLLLTRMIPLVHRGIFTDTCVAVRHSFPFGLVESWRTFPIERPVVVYPQRGHIDLSRLLRRVGSDPAHRGQHRAAVRHLADGTDLHGLRPLRPGDSPRWIHWRTTARIGELMVREFDRATGPSLTAVVIPPTSEKAFEQHLSCVATLVWEWTRRQDGRLKLWLLLARDWEYWELDHRRRATDLLRRLAGAQFMAATPATGPELPSRGPIVYISNEPEAPPIGANSETICSTQNGDVYHPPVVLT